MISDNLSNTAHRGRDPELVLQPVCSNQRETSLVQWGRELLEQMSGPAELLDQHSQSQRYSAALAKQLAKMDNPDLTPSARVLREMKSDFNSFYEFARSWSMRHSENLSNGNAASEHNDAFFTDIAASSHARAEQLEQESTGSLEVYLDEYFAQLSNGELDQYRVANS